MTLLEISVYTSNVIIAVVVMYLSIRISRASTTYTWNPADEVIKTKMKWIILKSLLGIVALAFIAAISNLSVVVFQ